MRRFLLLPLTFALAGCATWMLGSAMYVERTRADLEVKFVQAAGFRFAYAEGGEGETILLLHGFAGNKDHWTRMARYLTDRYRVIAPDLPGHGENEQKLDENYSIPSQARRLREFVRVLGPERFHLAGNSMGGAIAAYFASEYPDDILSLFLIDAAGVQSPEKSEMTLLLAKGQNPLLVENVQDFDRLLRFTAVNPPYIPDSVKAHFAEQAVKNRPFNEKIFRDIRADGGGVEDRLPRIKAPTFVLWGDTDRVIHVSSVKVFEQRLPNLVGTRIMKECGHAPMIERPEETASVYTEFLSRLQDSRKHPGQ